MEAYAQTKNIVIDSNPELTTTSVSIEQTVDPLNEGIEVGGVKLITDLPWYIDTAIILVIIAVIYVGKKAIDKFFK